MGRRPVRLGVAQLRCLPADPARNAELGARAIVQAAEAGAELVVLPELASSGYHLDRQLLADSAEELDRPGPCLRAWSVAARDHGVAVVGGFVERAGDRLYNAVVVLDEEGHVVGHYRKLHLFRDEVDVFSPGDLGLPVFHVAGLRIGVLVCYDLRFPEALRILALQGAQVIAAPTAWVAGFDRHVPTDGCIGQVAGALVQANLSQVYVVCADQVGTIDGVELLGRSVVCDPYGDLRIGPLSPDRQEVAVVEIDAADVDAARHRGGRIDPHENRRIDVYDELLGYVPSSASGPAARRALS